MKVVRFLTSFLLLSSVAINVLFIALFTAYFGEINRKMVFDLDRVRNDYIKNCTRMYIRGCLDGVDYPLEYRKAQTDFNQNSPPGWCKVQSERHAEEIYDDALRTGRKRD